MLDELRSAVGSVDEPSDPRILGVAVAVVLDNIDLTGAARVQLRLPWLPGVEPWARLAVLSAGDGRGTFFIPQVDDEVLVAFAQGDVMEPYVLGSLWSLADLPPHDLATDAVSKRIVKTPEGHVIEIDDSEGSITIRTSKDHTVRIGPDRVELEASGGGGKVSLEDGGTLTLEATTKIELKAPQVVINADTSFEARSNGTASIGASGSLDVQGSLVKIN
jgi:uncharacterized protein involved in type VI secretion and phage assembly